MLVENFGSVPFRTNEDRKHWKGKCDEPIPVRIDLPGNSAHQEVKLRKIARVNIDLVPFDQLEDGTKRIDLHMVAAHEWIKTGER